MTDEEIMSKLDEIISLSLNHHRFQLSPGLVAKDIDGWDSMATAMVITSIEKEFGIKFKFSDMTSWKTVGDLKNIILKKLQ